MTEELCGGGGFKTHQLIQIEEGGAIPTSPHHFKIEEGKFSDFSNLLAKHHYKGNKIGGGISHHLVLKYNGVVYGGIVIGKMRHQKSYDENSTELRRMVLSEKCPKNTASYFLSKTIWWLKNNTDVTIVYTFADQSAGHKGTCYKASNFEFVKVTPPSKYVIWDNKRYHMRSLTIDRPYSYRLREAVKKGGAVIKTGLPKILFKYHIKRKYHHPVVSG